MKYRAVCPPEWLSRSAVYQINPRTFSGEGTIAAVTRELPALAEMGFRVLYLCPIFEEDASEDPARWSARQRQSGTNNPKNPYRMNNYFRMDPEYGTEDDLRELVAAAHALGMRILLDLVYLHIGPNAPILKRHPEFARQDRQGNLLSTAWNFPYLDFECQGLREYLWCNMVYYVGEFDVDGFRCDVGDGVPLDFWVEARRRIRAIKPDAALINEGRDWRYLLRAFDSSYCFDWHDTLYRTFSEGRGAADCRACLEKLMAEVPEGSKLILDIDNHDTVTDWETRAETAAGHDGMEQIEVINYLSDGIPMVYTGNELADTARLSMFANRFHRGSYEATDRAGLAAREEGMRRRTIITQLNRLKRESDVLCFGDTVWLDNTTPDTVLSFRRSWQGETITFIGNFSREAVVTILDRNPDGTTLLSHRAEVMPDGSVRLGAQGYCVLAQESPCRH